jgi:(p)ppGpp synthase/HD superfamily hydrolase
MTNTDYERLIHEAEQVATLAHKGQTYDIFPYVHHVRDVVNILIRFGYVGKYLCGAWLHDTIEDTTITYNKVKRVFGEEFAELVLAVTDPCDVRSRKEKKAIVYPRIKANPDALIVKLADRIANVEHGIRMGNKDKTKMYRDEYPEFRSTLKVEGHADTMWDHLDALFEIK